MSAKPVALVTGAAGDLGRATALELARSFDLALADHPSAAGALEATGAACGDAGAAVHLAAFDVTDPGAVREGVGAAVEALGPPRALVANAGVQGSFARIDRVDLDDARRVLDVNVFGTLVVVQIAAAAMVTAGTGGSMVCTASMAGVSGAPNMAAYSASKAAVLGLVRTAAKDLAPAGIRVNAVSPAFIGPGRMWDAQVAAQAAAPSPYFGDEPDEVAAQMLGMVPLGRYGSPHEVAGVVAFLLSDAASYLTGINVEIAGGSA